MLRSLAPKVAFRAAVYTSAAFSVIDGKNSPETRAPESLWGGRRHVRNSLRQSAGSAEIFLRRSHTPLKTDLRLGLHGLHQRFMVANTFEVGSRPTHNKIREFWRYYGPIHTHTLHPLRHRPRSIVVREGIPSAIPAYAVVPVVHSGRGAASSGRRHTGGVRSNGGGSGRSVRDLPDAVRYGPCHAGPCGSAEDRSERRWDSSRPIVSSRQDCLALSRMTWTGSGRRRGIWSARLDDSPHNHAIQASPLPALPTGADPSILCCLSSIDPIWPQRILHGF
jgi:hypothetical protein